MTWALPDEKLVWEEEDNHRLEKDLTSIVVALIVAAERQYRAGRQYHFEWLVERKVSLIEEIQRREDEARRFAEERRIQTEQSRVDRLLADANSLRQAREIRDYVGAVRQLHTAQDEGMPTDKLETWASWAVAQAERIDPVSGLRFIESMNDEDPG
jgi:C4-dicarboxylate-specific signal transduction histidine kinase